MLDMRYIFFIMLAVLAFISSCAPTVVSEPSGDFPIPLGQKWVMTIDGKNYIFTVTKRVSSDDAAQVKFYIYEGQDEKGNTVEASSLIGKVLSVRVFTIHIDTAESGRPMG
ncbi:MAG: hypothetical protein C4331_15130 [Meiothermus sp.]